jgi:hypothetical protein
MKVSFVYGTDYFEPILPGLYEGTPVVKTGDFNEKLGSLCENLRNC